MRLSHNKHQVNILHPKKNFSTTSYQLKRNLFRYMCTISMHTQCTAQTLHKLWEMEGEVWSALNPPTIPSTIKMRSRAKTITCQAHMSWFELCVIQICLSLSFVHSKNSKQQQLYIASVFCQNPSICYHNQEALCYLTVWGPHNHQSSHYIKPASSLFVTKSIYSTLSCTIIVMIQL